MTTDKLIAELKLVSWVDRKPGMGSMDAVYLDDAIQIIRNHQPEPTQKQVDEAELLEIITVLQASGWEYGTHPMVKARIVLDAIRPYLRQVDNVGGEPQLVSGDVVEKLKELINSPFIGVTSTFKMGRKAGLAEALAYIEEAALQTPQPAMVDNAELEKVRDALARCYNELYLLHKSDVRNARRKSLAFFTNRRSPRHTE